MHKGFRGETVDARTYVRLMWDTVATADLDGDAVCVALDRARAALVAAEVAESFLAGHWADLHPGEAVEVERRARRRRGQRNPRGSERGRQLGADGTPLVALSVGHQFKRRSRGEGHSACSDALRPSGRGRQRQQVRHRGTAAVSTAFRGRML